MVNGFGSMAPAQDDRRSRLRQKLQEAQQRFQQQQDQLRARTQDLDLTKGLLRVLDSRVPKPARQFLFREMTRRLGGDPKGARGKEVETMLTALDPDSLNGLRSRLTQMSSTARPGEIAQFTRSILSGEADATAVIDDLLSGGGQQGQQGQEEPGIQLASAGAGPGSRPGGAADGLVQPAQRRDRQAIGEREVDPALLQALGLDQNEPMTHRGLQDLGFTVPRDLTQQGKLAREIQETSRGALTSAIEASRLVELFRGNPQTLGVVGLSVRTAEGAIQQIKGAFQLLIPDFIYEASPESPGMQALVRRTGSQLEKLFGLQSNATTSARIRSGVMAMAHAMAFARGITGNRLTNAILSRHMVELGDSQSPAQFEATLADTLRRTIEAHSMNIAARTGRPIQPNMRTLTVDHLQLLGRNSHILPEDFRAALRADVQRRIDGLRKVNPGTDNPEGQPGQPQFQQQRFEGDDETEDDLLVRTQFTSRTEGQTPRTRRVPIDLDNMTDQELNGLINDRLAQTGSQLTDGEIMRAIEDVTGIRINKQQFLDSALGGMSLIEILRQQIQQTDELRPQQR